MFLSIAMLIFAFGVVFFRIWEAEDRATAREVTSVARVFENHERAILNEIERYAASNAAYLNTSTLISGPWIKTRFVDDMAREFEHSAAFLLAPDNSLVFENTRNPSLTFPSRIAQIPTVQRSIHEVQTQFTELTAGLPVSEINFAGKLGLLSDIQVVSLDNAVALVSVFAIVPDPGGIPIVAPIPYVLSTVHILDRPHLDLILQNLSLADLNHGETVPAGMNSFPLSGADGQIKGYLYWRPMSQGMAILMATTPMLILFLAVIVLLAITSIRGNAQARQQLAKVADQSRYDADHDSLTDLPRRGHFFEEAERILRDPDRDLTHLIFVEINRLKFINDSWGSSAGDAVVRTVGQRIKSKLDDSHFAGRIGGDEFMILVSDPSEIKEIHAITREYITALNQPILINGTWVEISCRAGVAKFPDHGETIRDLVHAADIALRRSGADLHAAFCVFDSSMDDGLLENRLLRHDLLTAVRNGEMMLYYQPIVRNMGEAPMTVEALLRWNHPTLGILPPGRFLPLAETVGVMPELSEWVLQQAIKDASNWPMEFGVSVNITTSQFLKPGFTTEVRALLSSHGLAATKLTLEITESQLLDQVEDTQAVQENLNKLGVRFALDDFGTGYSSLSYLHLYNFEVLKIDRSFLQGDTFTANKRGLLTTMINIGQVLGMSVVVEGVETEEQRTFLRQTACGYLQGYLFARPMPLADLIAAYNGYDASPKSVPGAG
ncbi:putative bifunctional diguanylate cyclase/phosphodiesterase [Shimia sp.]|uniref:putative bifunctional diguanylate cyclase/phosphodiesterase n=1 Tax=Shimia sp. TaxID=1954381 RepID=UPI003B8B9377